MKKILITQRVLENQQYPERRDALDVRWAKFAERLGCCLVPLPSACNPESFLHAVAAEGVVFSSGNDLSSFSNTPENVWRDQSERRVLECALRLKLPVIGICRGMQFLAQYFGWEVVQRQGHVGIEHAISPSHSSRFRGFSESRVVNSYHKHCVEKGSAPLCALMGASDGSVEAFEHLSLPVVGIMWHPERGKVLDDVPQIHPADREIFQSVLGL